jgi:hypothetical protein
MARFFPFLAGAVAVLTFDFWRRKVASSGLLERFSNFSSLNLMFVGIMLFLIARMLAFAVASHKTFGIP